MIPLKVNYTFHSYKIRRRRGRISKIERDNNFLLPSSPSYINFTREEHFSERTKSGNSLKYIDTQRDPHSSTSFPPLSREYNSTEPEFISAVFPTERDDPILPPSLLWEGCKTACIYATDILVTNRFEAKVSTTIGQSLARPRFTARCLSILA